MEIGKIVFSLEAPFNNGIIRRGGVFRKLFAIKSRFKSASVCAIPFGFWWGNRVVSAFVRFYLQGKANEERVDIGCGGIFSNVFLCILRYRGEMDYEIDKLFGPTRST